MLTSIAITYQISYSQPWIMLLLPQAIVAYQLVSNVLRRVRLEMSQLTRSQDLLAFNLFLELLVLLMMILLLADQMAKMIQHTRLDSKIQFFKTSQALMINSLL